MDESAASPYPIRCGSSSESSWMVWTGSRFCSSILPGYPGTLSTIYEGTWRRGRTTSHMCSEHSSMIVTTAIGYMFHGEPSQHIATPALSTSLLWRLRQTNQYAFRAGESGLVDRFVCSTHRIQCKRHDLLVPVAGLIVRIRLVLPIIRL